MSSRLTNDLVDCEDEESYPIASTCIVPYRRLLVLYRLYDTYRQLLGGTLDRFWEAGTRFATVPKMMLRSS